MLYGRVIFCIAQDHPLPVWNKLELEKAMIQRQEQNENAQLAQHCQKYVRKALSALSDFKEKKICYLKMLPFFRSFESC